MNVENPKVVLLDPVEKEHGHLIETTKYMPNIRGVNAYANFSSMVDDITLTVKDGLVGVQNPQRWPSVGFVLESWFPLNEKEGLAMNLPTALLFLHQSVQKRTKVIIHTSYAEAKAILEEKVQPLLDRSCLSEKQLDIQVVAKGEASSFRVAKALNTFATAP